LIPTDRKPTTPQQILIDEFMIPMNLTIEDISALCGLSKMGLRLFVDGRKPMNPYLAEKLAAGLGTSPEFWMIPNE